MTLAQLSFEWMVIFSVISLMAGFLVGQAMDGVMGAQGFGPIGNMLILAAGFHLGLFQYEALWRVPDGIEFHIAFAIATAFLILFCLALIKRIMMRS